MSDRQNKSVEIARLTLSPAHRRQPHDETIEILRRNHLHGSCEETGTGGAISAAWCCGDSVRVRTWQPSRDVSVRPNARSSMSFSSSVGSCQVRGATSAVARTAQQKGIAFLICPRDRLPKAVGCGGKGLEPARTGILAYIALLSMIRWHVLHASDPSHAPSRSTLFSWATSKRFSPTGALTVIRSPSLSTKVTVILRTERIAEARVVRKMRQSTWLTKRSVASLTDLCAS